MPLTTDRDILVAELSAVSFRRGVRAAIRALWTGTIGLLDFFQDMARAIETGFEQAWSEGAAEFGIKLTSARNESRRHCSKCLLRTVHISIVSAWQ